MQYEFIDGAVLDPKNRFLICDLSYCLYVTFARTQKAYQEHFEDMPEDSVLQYEWDIVSNKEFFDLFSRNFMVLINSIKKKTNCKKTIFCRDCNKRNIWRRDIYLGGYKEHRLEAKREGLNFRQFIHEWLEKFFPKLLDKVNNYLLYHCNAEADDCVAISSEFLSKIPDFQLFILCNDMDLYQLKKDNVTLYNAQHKLVGENAEFTNPKQQLLLKIIQGDTSDNISAIFEKTKDDKILGRGCGTKTAKIFVENMDLLKEYFEKYPLAKEKFRINRQVIDFKFIPQNIKNEIIQQIETSTILI